MIVRQFLHWVRTAPAGERAEATSALARAYLYSDLSTDDRAAAEGAMIMLLDDPSPLVRRALADVFAGSERAPPTVVHALAADQPEVAAPVLQRSPLFVDADLVEAVATGEPERQVAIASALRSALLGFGRDRRSRLRGGLPGAAGKPRRRHRAVFARPHRRSPSAIWRPFATRCWSATDLPAPTRQALVVKLSETLADFVTAREWLGADRARRITREACEKATIALAADTPESEVRPLVHHLRESGQLTAGLMLRALLSGNVELFEEALAELAELPLRARRRHRARPARLWLPRALRQGRPAGLVLSRRSAKRSRPCARTAS